MPLVPIPVTDEQAKAVQKLADFGTTVVEETGQLARYMGRVLGTAPEDVVGLVIGDPLHFVRTAIAFKYDEWITRLHRNRGVTPEPVSPSLAIPLLRAAYDESRPELQELWAQLIAAAMDPQRAKLGEFDEVGRPQTADPAGGGYPAKAFLTMRSYSGPADRAGPENFRPNPHSACAERCHARCRGPRYQIDWHRQLGGPQARRAGQGG